MHWIRETFKTIVILENWKTIIVSNIRFGKGTSIARLRCGVSFKIRRNRVDAHVLREIFYDKIYHKYIDRLGDTSVVLDIGGNIGAFSILAAKQNSKVRVYTYEPFEENFLLLKDNIALNGLENHINAFKNAIGGDTCEKIILSSGSSGVSNLYEKRGKQVLIKMLSLKDVFLTNNIQVCDLLKIDCEGAEYEILYSTPQEIFDRVKFICLEFHEKFGTGKGVELKAFLEKKGFHVAIEGNVVGYIFAEKCDMT